MSQVDAGAEAKDLKVLRRRAKRLSVWRESVPILYDFFLEKDLEWPSLTVDWVKAPAAGRNASCRGGTAAQLVLGTQTSGQEQDYLLVCSLSLAKDAELEGGQGEDKGICEPQLSVVAVFQHEGDVDRASCSPHDPRLIATQCNGSGLSLYQLPASTSSSSNLSASDRSHSQRGASLSRNARLARGGVHDTLSPPIATYLLQEGREPESLGLQWSPGDPDKLLTTCANGYLSLLSLDQRPSTLGSTQCTAEEMSSQLYAPTLGPATRGHTAHATYYSHSASTNVNDISFLPSSPSSCCFGSVGDDGCLVLWDTRLAPAGAAITRLAAHPGGACNSLAVSPLQAHLLATSSSTGSIKVWDLRKLSSQELLVFAGEKPIPHRRIRGHKCDISQVSWAPHKAGLLASVDADRRVFLWDIGGKKKSQVRMIHVGHAGPIHDIAWGPAGSMVEGMLASVSPMEVDGHDDMVQDNVLQIWRPAGM